MAHAGWEYWATHYEVPPNLEGTTLNHFTEWLNEQASVGWELEQMGVWATANVSGRAVTRRELVFRRAVT